MDIGSRIRTARKAAGLSQEELARRAGMSLKGMGDIERGDIEDPHYSSLIKIADGLGVSIWKLLEEIDSPKPVPPPDPGQSERHDAQLRSTARLLEAAGVEARWFLIPHEEWLEAFRGESKAIAAEKLVAIARESKEEYRALRPLLFVGERNSLGEPTVPPEYEDIHQQVADRRNKIDAALHGLEKDAAAPRYLRERAQELLREEDLHQLPASRDEEKSPFSYMDMAA